MDKDTKLAILSLLEALRESMENTSETRISSLRIDDALVKARVLRGGLGRSAVLRLSAGR
jgi:hypothetical protein